MLRYVLLALIAERGPLHGYALMKAFAARSGIRLSIGNVYRELQRLRSEGHIEAVENPADADPRRAPYGITAAGRAALAAWFTVPAESFLREPADPLYGRLALLADGQAAQAIGFLDDLEAELAQHRRIAERRRATASEASPVLRALLGRRARHLAADMEMVGEMRAAVEALRAGAAVERRPARPARRLQRTERRAMVANRSGR